MSAGGRGGLTSLAGREGSPGRGCVTGAPELQPRVLDFRSRRSIRKADRAAMKLAKGSACPALGLGSTVARDLTRGHFGGEERRAVIKQPISESAAPHGPLEVVVHSLRPLQGQRHVLGQKCYRLFSFSFASSWT